MNTLLLVIRLVIKAEFRASGWRPKNYCSKAVDILKAKKVHDQIAFYAFHSFLVEVKTCAGYLRVEHS